MTARKNSFSNCFPSCTQSASFPSFCSVPAQVLTAMAMAAILRALVIILPIMIKT